MNKDDWAVVGLLAFIAFTFRRRLKDVDTEIKENKVVTHQEGSVDNEQSPTPRHNVTFSQLKDSDKSSESSLNDDQMSELKSNETQLASSEKTASHNESLPQNEVNDKNENPATDALSAAGTSTAYKLSDSLYVEAGSFLQNSSGGIEQPSSTRTSDNSSSDEETAFKVVPMPRQRIHDNEAVDAQTQEILNHLSQNGSGDLPPSLPSSTDVYSSAQTSDLPQAQESLHVGMNSPSEERKNRTFSSARCGSPIPEVSPERSQTEDAVVVPQMNSPSQFSDSQNINENDDDRHLADPFVVGTPMNVEDSDVKLIIQEEGNIENGDHPQRPTLRLRLKTNDDKIESSESSSSSSGSSSLADPNDQDQAMDNQNANQTSLTSLKPVEIGGDDNASSVTQHTPNAQNNDSSYDETQFNVVPLTTEQNNLNEKVDAEYQRLINQHSMNTSNGWLASLDSGVDIYSSATRQDPLGANDYPTGPVTSPIQQPSSSHGSDSNSETIFVLDNTPGPWLQRHYNQEIDPEIRNSIHVGVNNQREQRHNRAFVSGHIENDPNLANVPSGDLLEPQGGNRDLTSSNAGNNDSNTQGEDSDDGECSFVVTPIGHADPCSPESVNLPQMRRQNDYPTNEDIFLAQPECDEDSSDSSTIS